MLRVRVIRGECQSAVTGRHLSGSMLYIRFWRLVFRRGRVGAWITKDGAADDYPPTDAEIREWVRAVGAGHGR